MISSSIMCLEIDIAITFPIRKINLVCTNRQTNRLTEPNAYPTAYTHSVIDYYCTCYHNFSAHNNTTALVLGVTLTLSRIE